MPHGVALSDAMTDVADKIATLRTTLLEPAPGDDPIEQLDKLEVLVMFHLGCATQWSHLFGLTTKGQRNGT